MMKVTVKFYEKGSAVLPQKLNPFRKNLKSQAEMKPLNTQKK